MLRTVRFAASAVTLLAVMLFSVQSHASVIIGGTRVIYPAQEKQVTIRLENKAELPALVQAWLDTGDEASTPDRTDVPFTLTPPIFRMEPNKQQALRLSFIGEPLPSDRESLFWLNVLEVPPKPENSESSNLLQFAFRTRIKVFYRPQGLPYDVNDAPSKLTWKLVEMDGGYALEVNNPTPYYVSFEKMDLLSAGRSYPRKASSDPNGNMVAPLATNRFPIPGMNAKPATKIEVDYTTITDYGARLPSKQPATL